MDAKSFSLLAAAIFAALAGLQFARAAGKWPVSIHGLAIPVWVSWLVCLIAAALAWTGFAAALS